ncbi:dipeptide epimerase [Sandaracinobacter neustonicus]|uniref:Dipeptide epimerase n=1 Tax=Sandaracinobacter neustonicus TaxID=1715348 RepID=A0A501XLC9_9SPHN|nr:dipeptide epimerase [Sandaracinobacter neustonicus]TPE60987.1 dipeptide epimerase [Sandaracinobacter neustonicus]
MDLLFAYQQWPYAETFRISRSAQANSELFTVYLRDGGLVGRGECGLLPQYGQGREDVEAALIAAAPLLAEGATRARIAAEIANSSARNALDSALWDLECRRAGQDIWQLVGVPRRAEIEVDLTISVNPTAKMRDDALAAFGRGFRILKLKAGQDEVLERVEAIAAACPSARLIVDANEAWDIDTLNRLAEPLRALGVELIEQPLHHKADDALAGYGGAIPLCADESCSSIADLDRLSRLYQAINIKLDKVGGLTPGLELQAAAHARGLKVMLGCSGPTSLGAAPAYVLGTLCDYVDLDGPALLLDDRAQPMAYEQGKLLCFDSGLWGG